VPLADRTEKRWPANLHLQRVLELTADNRTHRSKVILTAPMDQLWRNVVISALWRPDTTGLLLTLM
jgi:hypothetical protein